MTEMTVPEAKQLSPLGLAYIGDGIYELMTRCRILEQGNRPVQSLHRRTVSLVCASAQSKALLLIEGELSEEELSIYKRGRNADSHPPRNADPAEYRRATGLEALFGYLYLTGQQRRLEELHRRICDHLLEGAENGSDGCE